MSDRSFLRFNKRYEDEAIPAHPVDKDLPKPLRVARELEKKFSSLQLFFRQAILLAKYTDNYVYDKERNIVRYYPTYHALSNAELRSYFSWRTKWRNGELNETSLSFAFLYIYELLHLVGCVDAQDGFNKLKDFARDYAVFNQRILPYLKKWIVDFVVYYGLDPALLADTEDVRRDNALAVLMEMPTETDAEIFEAVLELSGAILRKSRFYKEYPQMTQAVFVGTLRQVKSHFEASSKKNWIANYFGEFYEQPIRLFEKAVFYKRRKIDSAQIELSPLRKYRCVQGRWYLYSCFYEDSCHKKFLDLIRTVDSLMRKAVKFPHPIYANVTTKWVIKIIEEEIQKFQKGEQIAKKKKLNLDLSQLCSIRSDAVVTREKLLTDEEMEEEKFPPIVCSVPDVAQQNDGFNSLSQQEKHYLQCLLEGTSTKWTNDEGILPSLLCDSINEKLYEIFEDTVLENEEIIEDYKEELRKGLQL